MRRCGNRAATPGGSALWVNRVVGDLQPAAARRFAFVGYPQLSKATPLRESGLLGPVRLEATAPRIAPQSGR